MDGNKEIGGGSSRMPFIAQLEQTTKGYMI